MSRRGPRSHITAIWFAAAAALAVAGVIPALAAQRGAGCCTGMMGGSQMEDMRLIHTLLANRDHIRRNVTVRPDGVETLTESDDQDLAKAIQAHVNAMYARLNTGTPIHQRDPLFREIFRHAPDIRFSHELTPGGIKVIETSSNPYVVRLIQAHAAVLDLFLKNGHSEMMKNHNPSASSPSVSGGIASENPDSYLDRCRPGAGSAHLDRR